MLERCIDESGGYQRCSAEDVELLASLRGKREATSPARPTASGRRGTASRRKRKATSYDGLQKEI